MSISPARGADLLRDDFDGASLDQSKWGIGTWLLQRLIETARARGIRGFVGYVLSSNVRMLNLFHRCGFPVESRLESGIYTVTIRFPEGKAGGA